MPGELALQQQLTRQQEQLEELQKQCLSSSKGYSPPLFCRHPKCWLAQRAANLVWAEATDAIQAGTRLSGVTFSRSAYLFILFFPLKTRTVMLYSSLLYYIIFYRYFSFWRIKLGGESRRICLEQTSQWAAHAAPATSTSTSSPARTTGRLWMIYTFEKSFWLISVKYLFYDVYWCFICWFLPVAWGNQLGLGVSAETLGSETRVPFQFQLLPIEESFRRSSLRNRKRSISNMKKNSTGR